MTEVTLRDYQMESVRRARAGAASGHRAQVLMAPAGAGKTEIAAYMLQEAARKFSKALFIVDRVVLVDQTSERLDRYGIPHGVIQAGHWRWRPYERIQVCSAQTLERRGIPEDVQVVFVDEAHCMRKKVTEYLQSTKALVIGLTATPFTKGMGKVYSGMVNVTTTNELISQGYLSPLKMYVAKAIRTEGMKVVAGEWSEKEIEQRGLEIIGDIVSEWQDKTERHFGGPVKTIVFSATVDHGAELCRQFRAAGYDFRQISYKDGGDDERRAIIEEFRKPNSSIHGLVSCEVFTKGFDVSDVKCIASGQCVLTDKGPVPIEKVTLEHKLWDGIEYVEHQGVIFKGYQHVIEYAGIIATPDHEAHTAQGWRTLGDCAAEQIAITQTGLGGTPIRIDAGCFAGGDLAESWQMGSRTCHVRMHPLRGQVGQRPFLSAIYAANLWMQTLLHESNGCGARGHSSMAGSARCKHEGALRTLIAQGVSGLRRSWHRVSFCVNEIMCGMGHREPGFAQAGQQHAARPDQQQRALRTWQSPVGIESAQLQQYASWGMGGDDASVPDRASGNSLCRQDASQSVRDGSDLRSGRGTIPHSVRQAKRPVWDILQAGPRNRFTCEGLLVHNCGISARPYRKSLSSHIQQMGRVMRASPDKEYGLWLCHTGNVVRFHADTEEVFQNGMDALDDGAIENKVRKEPTEKEIAEAKCSCGCLLSPGSQTCPGCGKECKRRTLVDQLAGELVEVDGNKLNRHTGWIEKAAFIGELRAFARAHGYASGWVAHKYRARFGVWPNDPRVRDAPAREYGAETARWLKSQAIRYAKARSA